MTTHAAVSVLWFMILLACVPLALWLRRRTPGGGIAPSAGLRRVAMLPLSPSQRVVTVEVGSGDDRRWLVLGVTPQAITTLHTMAPQAAEGMVQPGSAAGAMAAFGAPSFAQLLGRLRSGKPAGDMAAP